MDTSMESEFEVSGTVEEVSEQLFVVSAEINNERKFLWCHRDRVFSQGLHVGESLCNVLEQCMQVDMIVRTDEVGQYHVLAAWVGDKPEIIEVYDKRLHPVYGKQGNLRRSEKDGSLWIVSREGDFSVLFRTKEDIYLDGFPLADGTGTEDFIGQIVSFDAVPLKRADTSGATYAATCVWLGETIPRIVDRFRLHGSGKGLARDKTEIIDSDDDIESLESPLRKDIPLDENSDTDDDIQIIDVVVKNKDFSSAPFKIHESRNESRNMFEKFAVGTVCVIPSEVLALVDVCIDDVEVKVMLFRNSFKDCYNIRDFVKVGDSLSLLLRSVNIFQKSNLWFVVKACRDYCDPRRLAEMMLPVEIGNVSENERVLQGTASGLHVETEDVKAPVVLEIPARATVESDCDARLSKPVKVETSQQADKEHNTQDVPVAQTAVVKREPAEVVVVKEVPIRTRGEVLKPVELKPLGKQYTTEDVVLNGTGRLRRAGTFLVADMELLSTKVPVLISLGSFYNKSGTILPLSQQIGNEVSFDALRLKKRNHSTGATHRAILCWQGVKPAPQTVLRNACLNPRDCCMSFRPDIVYVGFVIDVPLLDCCIVKFATLPVLVQSKSLLVDPWTKDNTPIVISDYLKFGDHVALTCKIENDCVVAEVCGALPSYDSGLFGVVGTFDKKCLSVTTNDVSVNPAEAEERLIDVLRCTPFYLEGNVGYMGIIVEFPYRNYAIAAIGEIRVLVHINCVVNVRDEKKHEDVDSISQLLNVGSVVLLWVVRKTVKFSSYYSAREARVISENSFKGKVVLKNYRGFVQDDKKCKQKQITVEVSKSRLVTDLYMYRIHYSSVPRQASVSQIDRKMRLFAPVSVNATVNNERGIVVHSVLLL